MASPIPHSQCGLYSMVGLGTEQLFFNGLTGELVTVTRSEKMMDAGAVYTIQYNAGGWAFLVGDPDKPKLWWKTLAFNKIAVVVDGRVGIQDKVQLSMSWADGRETISKSLTSTIELKPHEKSKWKLVCTTFDVERRILETRVMDHRILGGRTFWQLSSLQAIIDIGTHNPDTINKWVRTNYHRSREYWSQLMEKDGGGNVDAHWLPSQNSFKCAAEATW